VAAAADELYGLPLQEFTKARNELERRLRGEGKREEAQAVKALRKPTAAAWALNQLARRRGGDVAELLAAGERLRQAQDDLLEGGDREALAEAVAEERDVVARLARDATAIGAEAGLGSSAALEEKVRSTLHAAAADEETATELAAGRLVRERQAVGLIGFEQMPAGSRGAARAGARSEAGRARGSSETRAKPAGGPRARGTGKRTAAQERAERERVAREEQRREQKRELEESVKAARREETKLRRRVEAAERMTASARERAAKAAERLDAAEEDEASARGELEALSDQVERAERELKRLSRGR
jgi:hypothetical protein